MKLLRELIGAERSLEQVSGALREAVRSTAAPVVGALEVHCSDECELECGAAFQQQFVDYLLPELKTAVRTAFRTSNLGARYETGSIRVAEHHYATPASSDAYKLIVVKLNSHVAVVDGPDGPQFGFMQRYESDSTACGALHTLLAGGQWPALVELREAFESDGKDRIATLLDPRQVRPEHRYLAAAIACARLQARRAIEDIGQHSPHTPTLYLVMPCVTMNRSGPDTEVVVGFYWADHRTESLQLQYEGLGDDPGQYRFDMHGGRLHIASGLSA